MINLSELYRGSTLSPLLYRGYIDGLITSNDSDTAHDIAISAGSARSEDNSIDIILSSVLTKRIDASWSVGDDAGGMDTGSVAVSTWYHIYVIYDTTNKITDALFTATYGSPTMPAGYTVKRRIGSVLTDGSANIIAYHQIGDRFSWESPQQDSYYDGFAAATETIVTVPTGVKSIARLHVAITSGDVTWFSPLDIPDIPSGGLTNPPLGQISGSGANPTSEINVQVNTSATFRSSSVGNNYVRIVCVGWEDYRGKE